jgi:hypothetical protein
MTRTKPEALRVKTSGLEGTVVAVIVFLLIGELTRQKSSKAVEPISSKLAGKRPDERAG